VVQLKVRATEPSAAKKLDQWSFTIGVLGIVFSEYALVQHTELFHVWYAALVPPLILVKWGIYKTRKMHYFLLDFCYYVNFVLVAFLFAPGGRASCALLKTAFVLACGPVGVAVYVWRISLVFHDFDHMSTTYIHVLPPLVMLVARHYPGATFAATAAGGASRCDIGGGGGGGGSLGTGDLLVSLGAYLLWQGAYLLVTEKVRAHRFNADPELKSSLRWLVTDERYALHQFALRVCRRVGVFAPGETFAVGTRKTLAIFCTCQALYTAVTFAVTPLLYASRWACCAWCTLLCGLTVHHGASYYIHVFSKRYNDGLVLKYESVMQQAAGAAPQAVDAQKDGLYDAHDE
jgi:hypothetical protein